MNSKPARLMLSICIIIVVGLITFEGSGEIEEFKATSFSSTGDHIQGWYWLRDRNLSDKASWTFKGLPEGSDTIEAKIFALATDRASGGPGVDAHFRLVVGYPGSGNMGGVFCPQEVTLENVTPPGDPDGYKCRGTVRVDRNRQCGTSGSEIYIFAERISPNHPHVAFNKDSIVLRLRGSSDQDNPSNDAGSGSDAGDEIEEALSIDTGSFSGYLDSEDKEDWYKFRANQGQIISIDLIPPTETDYELYLYRPRGSSAEYSNSGKGERERIDYVAGASGVYSIRIRRSSGEGDYKLRLGIRNQNDAGSGGDAGNEKQNPYRVTPGSYSGFMMDDDDEDWYEFTADTGQIIQIGLVPPTKADYDLYLYRPGGGVAEYSNSKKGERERIDYVAGRAGEYSIRIKRTSGQGDYDFELSLENQNDAGSGGDAGNDKLHSLKIQPGSINGFLKDDDDEDWYQIEAKEGQVIELRLEVPAEADYDLYLRHEYKSSEYSNTGAGIAPELKDVAERPGPVYIEIKRRKGEGQYLLRVNQPSYQAADFSSSGEEIDGWSWLRDEELDETATWEFTGIDKNVKEISFDLTSLVSRGASAEVKAQFVLFVFTVQPGMERNELWSGQVSLPKTEPAAGAGEYFCSGTIKIPLSARLETLGPKLIVVIKRISPNHPELAFKSDTILLNTQTGYEEEQIEERLEKKLIATPPDAFNSSAIVSSGIHWCNQSGHYLEWGWGRLAEKGIIKEGAVNLTLPVSSAIEGGPGFDARVEARILDP
ncbi:MAG: PPC domain-containing protein, partial [Candidatus Bipolaricaulota bacterium]